jgi:hypothetical protein
MARQIINAKSVERLKAGERRQEVSDEKIPALRVVISPTGARSWALRARIAGSPVKLTLGSVDVHTLKAAREWASDTLLAIRAGRDPRAEKKEREAAAERQRRPEELRHQDTVTAIVERWLEEDQGKNRSAADVRGAMAAYVLPRLGHLPIRAVKRRELLEVVEHVRVKGGKAGKGAPTRANRLVAYLKRLFAWALERELIEVNPAITLKKMTKERSRDRVLEDGELISIWRAAEDLDAYGKLIRLLITTGARLREVADAKVTELTETGDLRLPADRSKNDLGRVIHLSGLARRILGEPPGPFLVSVTGDRPVSNLSERKRVLDGKAAELLGKSLPAWRVHDVRRTVATGLQRLDERLEVVEAVLGHTSGGRSGVVGVYQRHQWQDEAAAALDRWAEHLKRLLDQSGGTVVPMRRRRG